MKKKSNKSSKSNKPTKPTKPQNTQPKPLYDISMVAWQKMHPFEEVEYETDPYYHSIANKIGRILENNGLVGAFTRADIRYAALRLAAYFEDVVSELCIFRSFIMKYQQEYDNEFPWYQLDEEYHYGEVNLVDVRLVLWLSLLARRDSSVPNPENIGILNAASVVYVMFLEEVDKAPKNEELSNDIFGDELFEDLDTLKTLLRWLASSCYLSMRMFPVRKELTPTLDALLALFPSAKSNPVLARYICDSYIAFAQPCGTLAISPSEWLYEMGSQKRIIPPAEMLFIRNTPVYPFVITEEDEDTFTMYSCRGKEYIVSKESYLQPQQKTLGVGDIVVTMLFRYKEYWNVFGIARSEPIRDLNKAFDELERRTKNLTKASGAKVDLVGELDWDIPNNSLYGREYDPIKCARAIAINYGSRLFYFKNVNEANKWMEENIVCQKVIPFNQPDCKSSIALFITEDFRIIFTNLARYIHDPDNPYYEPSTDDEIFSMMLRPEALCDPICEYMIEYDYADRLGFESLYGLEHGRRLVQNNIRFFMTLMRQYRF